MGRRPILIDAWIISRLRHGESWVAAPLWALALALLIAPKVGGLLVVPAALAFLLVVAFGGTRTERRDVEVSRHGVRVGRAFVPRGSIRARGARARSATWSTMAGGAFARSSSPSRARATSIGSSAFTRASSCTA